MRAQHLSFGVVIGRDDFKVILLDNGYLQLMEDVFMTQVKPDDYVFFVPKRNGKSGLVVPLDEFDYFENIRCSERNDNDPILFKDNGGLCVPSEALRKSKKFIVNNGFGYQYIVYYQHEDVVYADWNYSHQEQTIINAFFTKKLHLKDTFDINQKLNDIDLYLNGLDVDNIIGSFTIENEEIFKRHPGKDDNYYVDKIYKDIDEPFINQLFPHRSETIYKDSGFCTAESMSINPPKRSYKEEENELKKAAKEKYNKDEHRRFLIERMMWEYKKDVIERCENTNYKNRIFSRAIMQLVDVDRWKILEGDYEDYLTQICKTFNSFIDSTKESYKYFTEG